MKTSRVSWITASAVMAGLVFAIPSFAQSNSYSSTSTTTTTAPANENSTAPESEHTWRDSARNLGRAAEADTSHAYHDVKRTAKDASLEARVKTVLHEDRLTRHADVHVTADSGMVTLTGQVPSARTARHAQEVVASISGVRGVNNDLSYVRNGTMAAPRDSDSTGIDHPAYSHTAPADHMPNDQ